MYSSEHATHKISHNKQSPSAMLINGKQYLTAVQQACTSVAKSASGYPVTHSGFDHGQTTYGNLLEKNSKEAFKEDSENIKKETQGL